MADESITHAFNYLRSKQVVAAAVRHLCREMEQSHLTDEDVLEVFALVTAGYCTACGSTSLPCHCRNDE